MMMVIIFVPDVPDFAPLIDAVRGQPNVSLLSPRLGYWRIQAPHRLSFSRKALGLRIALWNSALSGGFSGRLTEYTNDAVTLESEP